MSSLDTLDKKRLVNDHRTLAKHYLKKLGSSWFTRARLAHVLRISSAEAERQIAALSKMVFLNYEKRDGVDFFKVIIDDSERKEIIEREIEIVKAKAESKVAFYNDLVQLMNNDSSLNIVN